MAPRLDLSGDPAHAGNTARGVTTALLDGKRPIPEVAEWSFPRGGGLQVYKGPERAGNCSFTLAVSDLEEQVRTLSSINIDVSQRTATDRVKTAMVRDPDGNSIAVAQALDPSLHTKRR